MNIRKWKEQYSKDVKLRYNSNQTHKNYESCIFSFLNFFNKYSEPKAIPTNEIKDYLLKFNTLNTRKANLCAIKSFYKLTLQMPKKIDRIPFPKGERKLPKVLDSDFIINRINQIKNLKHKAIISLAFSLGLRVSEVINLKINDVDSQKMIITIKNAKGSIDRNLPLSVFVLDLLRDYYKKYRPKEYLFNGQFSNQYSSRSCNQIVKKYIRSDIHFHTLRHSSFTSLHEKGTDIHLIQKIAGHKNIKTTTLYTHISTQSLKNIQLAL